MKKDLVLVLSIYEGRSWQPIDGYQTLIEAKLDSNSLCTDLVSLSSSPKFNTELTWEADKQTIRNYKLNRVPVKIQCLAKNSSTCKKIGYVILPLISAVEGVQIDSKWHKLLGGVNPHGKSPPEILLSLSLEALKETEKENSTASNKLHSGISEEMNHKYLNANGHKSYSSSNGNIEMSHGNGRNEEAQPAKTNNYDEQNDFDYDSDMDEEDLEKYLESDEDYMEEEEEFKDDKDDKDDQKQVKSDEIISSNGHIAKEVPPTRSKETTNHLNNEKSDTKSPEVDKPSSTDSGLKSPLAEAISGFENIPKDIEIRMSNRKYLEKVSRENKLRKVSDVIPDRIPFKRKLTGVDEKSKNVSQDGTGYSFDTTMIRSLINKNRIIQTTASSGFTAASNGITSTAKAITSTVASVRPKVSPVADHPSTSVEKCNSISTCFKGNYELPISCSRLVAELSQDGTYFQVGNENEIGQNKFELSVRLISAENLDKIISSDSENGYNFSYTLMGCPILTETFYNKSEVECSVQTSAATVRSTLANLFKYIGQHSPLLIKLKSVEQCVATSTIDMRQLLQINSSTTVSTVKGLYPLVATNGNISVSSDKNALLKVSVQLSWDAGAVTDYVNTSSRFPSYKLGQYGSYSSHMHSEATNNDDSEVLISDSSMSDNETTEVSRISKGFYRESRLWEKRMREEELIKRRIEQEFNAEKQSMLQQVAIEVNEWKECQKIACLKEWAKKEADLQSHLSKEWNSRVAIVEGDMNHRLQECDKLQDKFNQTLKDLSLREDSVKEREMKVRQMEASLKERLNSDDHHQPSSDVNERIKLNANVCQLEADLKRARDKIMHQTQETIELRKQIIQTNDRDDLIRERDSLRVEFSKCDERKKYYKTQWVRAIKETHRVLKFNQAAMEEDRMHRLAEESLGAQSIHPPLGEPSCHHFEPSPVSSRRDFRMRKLKEERKILMQNGNVSHRDPMLQSVNRRIRAMERGC